jgi:hypothetical protein
MREDYTDITLVVDRSGSMETMRQDAEGGINTFISQQAERPGECRVTLVQFDSEYEMVFRGVEAAACPRYQLVPRGSTALLDAVGRTIDDTGARLAALPEADRPGLVIFVITTDGMENSSRSFTRQQVRDMIAHQQQVYNWQFTFLAANSDAFDEAMQMGIDSSSVALYGEGKVFESSRALNHKISRMRQMAMKKEQIDNSFTDEERKLME